jgi:transposase
MIDYETYHRIRHYQQEGLNTGQIAQTLDLDPRTVDKWLEQGRYQPRQGGSRHSKLDPFKDEIVRLLEKHPYTATQIFQRMREAGFSGRYGIVKDYVRQIRPKRKPAFLSLSFAPGESAQVDWGLYKTIQVGGTRRQLNFFAMVLCYSRMLYVEFTLAQSMEHFLACHLHAFQYFGGVPAKIMIDNLKTGVLHCRPGDEREFNPKYLDFANHFGFTVKACGVRKGNEKGRVENAVGYVKKNFLNGLELTRFEALNPAIRIWLNEIANVRTHGETRQKPVDRLAEDLAHMRAVSPHSYDIARIKPVRASKLFRIALDTNHYSVPAEYASQALTLKIYPDRLCLYAQEQMIARHVRSFDRHQDIEDPDHPKALLAQRRGAEEQKLLQRFIALSHQADAYYRQLEQKRLNVRLHIRKIVALSEIYGREATARALEDALTFHAFSSEYIANLLEQRSQLIPEAGALHVPHRDDLLRLRLPAADLSVYQTPSAGGQTNAKK